MKKLLIIDTFNFLHRAYHALPPTFRDQNGEPVNAVYGVTSMLINVIDLVKPDYMVAALDGITPTFRSGDFTAYKAHRKPMDTDLSSQIPKVFEILDAFGIKKIVVEGYEADDIIGTLTKKYQNEVEVVIISNDRDLWQLADGSVVIMIPSNKTKGEFEFLSHKEAHERMGFPPEKIADYKGLRGDPSDNIPGVFGIGEKIATKLILEFGSVEEIYRNIEKVEPATLREKLLNNYEQALMSKKLAQLICDTPFHVELDECKFTSFNRGQVKTILEKYNFKSLIRRLGFEVSGDSAKKKPTEPSKDQLSLF